MIRCLVLLFVVALVLTATACVSAGKTTSTWELGEWDCTKNQVNPNVPILCREWDWMEAWPVTSQTEPDYLYELTGPAPSSNDPDVSQTVRNRTQTPWTDWHVSILNGTYTPGSAVVYNNNAMNPNWVIEPFEDGSGFFAHVVSGMGTQVDYYETLHIFFSYTVNNPNQNVSITEYPTDWYQIPEPGSIAGLLAGCLAFAFSLKRRS